MAVIIPPSKATTRANRRRRNNNNGRGKLRFLINTVAPILIFVYVFGLFYISLFGSLIKDQTINDDVTPMSKLASQQQIANVNANANANTNVAADKTEHLVHVLQKSGVQVTTKMKNELPSWNQVDKLYGSTPQIIGLETCAAFQSTVPFDDAYIGAAGLFNTGTNLLSKLLRNHCSIPSRQKKSNAEFNKQPFRYRWTGMLFHVPWGKHNPVSWRNHHVAKQGAEGVEHTHVLPVVMVKDPFHWMGSMCRHPYAAMWRHTPGLHCPNLVANESEASMKRKKGLKEDAKGRNVFKVSVAFQKSDVYTYTSLVDMYNQWYRDYLEIKDFPRLMIRYEDLLLYPEEIVTQVCHCGGGTVINAKNGIHHDNSSAKPNHKGSSGLEEALIRYGSEDHRTDTMTKEDLEYANEELDSELMNLFHYSYADAIAIQRSLENSLETKEEYRQRREKIMRRKSMSRKEHVVKI